jgi:ribonuclease HI
LGDCTSQSTRNRRTCARSAHWVRPPEGFVKINVDGAVSRNGDHGAISAVCRDENGLFLGASTRTINGISHPATLEAMACSEALSLAEDLGVTMIHVSFDCLEVINSLKGESLCSYTSILTEFGIRSSRFNSVRFYHESRDLNGDAHVLARNALGQVFGRRLWLINPPDFVNLLSDE